jgi:hypothetical protein
MDPDSGTTGIGELKTLRLTFSEKMDRTSAVTWLHFFPDQRIRQTKWHGATEAEVILEYPLTPDTVIVMEVASGMRDAHKLKSPYSRRFPLATADSIPNGSITGVLIMADSAVTRGVVELYDVPPDTLEYFEQPLLRRTTTDAKGAYRFDWLPVPGGPWLVRAFTDADDNLRPGERDALRLLPDTLRLTDAQPEGTGGVTTLFAWDTPGRILVEPFSLPAHVGPIRAWSMKMAEEDTGWVPAPEDGSAHPIFALDPAKGGILEQVQPGRNRVVVFVDVDGDSTFSGVPDTMLAIVPDSLRSASPDTTLAGDWFLEPWLIAEDIAVEPGLDTRLALPLEPYLLTPWTPPAPEPALRDTLEDLRKEAGAAGDTLTAPGDNE